MSDHFNQLAPAQAERLALLAEECGEVIQAVGKILRHGYESTHPHAQDPVTNRELLEKELGDLRHAIVRMFWSDDVREAVVEHHALSKGLSVKPYLHHQ